MAVVKTVIVVPSQNGTYNVPGDWTAEQIRTMYSTQIEGLAGMVATSSVAVDAGGAGEVRTHTFTPRVGNKG